MSDFGAAFDFARQDGRLEMLGHSLDRSHVGPALYDEAETQEMGRGAGDNLWTKSDGRFVVCQPI